MKASMLGYLLLLLFLGICVAASGPGESLKAEAWDGSFSYGTSGSGKTRGGTSWSYEGKAQGTFALDTFKEVPDRYVGTLDATLAYQASMTTPKGSCVEEQEFRAEGVLVNTHRTVKDAELLFHEGGWQLRIGRQFLHGTLTIRDVCPGKPTGTRQLDALAAIPYDSPNLPYPSSGPVLSGTFTVDDVMHGILGVPPEGQRATWHGQVQASPRGEFILEVDSPDYESWRPSAVVGADGAVGPGKPLEFTATLKHKSGKPAGVEIERVEWELIDTSREPGASINFPATADDGLDMRFEPMTNQVASDADKQHVTSGYVEKATDRARVVPLDWGGWSTLKVTAYVRNGPAVRGRFKGTTEDDVRLPKRSSKSFIADAWKRETGATGDDASDDDDSPVGDANRGDGLTLYEEYRGFYEGGQHHSGDPKKKDYFVRNEAGTVGEGGIRLFERKSGLTAHILTDSELGDVRVVNRNHRRGPHVVDQHGVILRFDPKNDAGVSETHGGPGTPADITFVGLESTLGDYPLVVQLVTTAHELLHTVNVPHHGTADGFARWVVSGDALYQGGHTIRVLTEGGADETRKWIDQIGEGHEISKWQGMLHGEHSGFENCIMRYDVARAYPSASDTSVRFAFETPEQTGTELCSSGTGVAVNASSHRPQSRYGTATAGNCKALIRVNDKFKVH